MDEWYCEIAGREIGPLLSQQLRAMAAKGQILPDDRVRRGAHGPWLPAQNVRGLFPQASVAANPKPAVSAPSSFGSLPVAQPAPKPRVFPPTPPPPPMVMPPMPDDIAGPVAVNFGADLFDDDRGTQAGAELTAFLRSKRRVRQQQMTVILLLVAIVGLAVAGLLLAIGGSSGSGQNGSATPEAKTEAKKTRAAQPEAESPEALEAREGVESLDAKSKPRKSGQVEPPKKRAATSGKSEKADAKTPAAATGQRSATADPDAPETSKPGGSKEATPKKKPRVPQPGTPEGDFGLPEVDPSIQ
jgi:hypothetical protein